MTESERIELIALGAMLAGAKLDIPAEHFHGEHAGLISAVLNRGKDNTRDELTLKALGRALNLDGPYRGIESIKAAIIKMEALLAFRQVEESFGRQRYHENQDDTSIQVNKAKQAIKLLGQYVAYQEGGGGGRNHGGGIPGDAKPGQKVSSPYGDRKKAEQSGATGGKPPPGPIPGPAGGV